MAVVHLGCCTHLVYGAKVVCVLPARDEQAVAGLLQLSALSTAAGRNVGATAGHVHIVDLQICA